MSAPSSASQPESGSESGATLEAADSRIALPLTEPPRAEVHPSTAPASHAAPGPAESPYARLLAAQAAAAQTVREEDIRALVDAFYAVVRKDDLLGPVFERHVQDWSLHLPKMYDFWSTVVLRTGRYAGRPFEVHARLPGLAQQHFDRWVALWERTVNERIPEPARLLFVESARRMASTMSSRLVA